MSKRKRGILLLLVFLLCGFLIAIHFTPQGQKLPVEHQREFSFGGQLQPDTLPDIVPPPAAVEIDSGANPANIMNDGAKPNVKLHCPDGTFKPEIAEVTRKQTWDKVLKYINSELSRCHDWFDTVNVLSAWLYQNIRAGDVSKYNIGRVIGRTYVLSHIDLKYLYNVNNSDSVTGDCGFHSYYAVLLYKHYGIKSYCYSMRPNPKRKNPEEGHRFATIAVGHMINVLHNPHDRKWYPVDNFFGIRYRYQGEWLDMKKYFQLAREEVLSGISVETFGRYKLQIHDSPCVSLAAWGIDADEIFSAEQGNSRNHYRIVAPYRLKQQFPLRELFDQIAATYDQPPHDDWTDLARRMPIYVGRMFPLEDVYEQIRADSLLSSWKQ
jgi:hypothetical protein